MLLFETNETCKYFIQAIKGYLSFVVCVFYFPHFVFLSFFAFSLETCERHLLARICPVAILCQLLALPHCATIS